jgi:hypothetical protein
MPNVIKYGPAIGPPGPEGQQGPPGTAVNGGRTFYLSNQGGAAPDYEGLALAPNGLEICVQNAGEYAVTLPHASSSASAGTRFAMPNGSGIVLAPATDTSQNPLGECVYARYLEGVDAPWSAEL